MSSVSPRDYHRWMGSCKLMVQNLHLISGALASRLSLIKVGLGSRGWICDGTSSLLRKEGKNCVIKIVERRFAARQLLVEVKLVWSDLKQQHEFVDDLALTVDEIVDVFDQGHE